jgi:hypothetical protein
VLSAAEPSAKSRFLRAAKTLLATLALTLILLSGVFFGKQFLLSRLVADFDSLDATNKQTRLIQIASFGTDAVQPLAEKLFSDDDAVSETAFTLLQKFQNDSITLKPDASYAVHRRLIASIATTSQSRQHAPPTTQQLARARELIRQTVLAFSPNAVPDAVATAQPSTVATTGGDVPALLVSANRLLSELGTHLNNPAIIVSSGVKISPPSQALSVSSAGRDAGWTDWPPPSRLPAAQIIRSGTKPEQLGSLESSELPDADSGGLQSVPRGVTVPLGDVASSPSITSPPQPVLAARPPVGRVLHMTSHLVDSPLEALSDETVVRHLANPDSMLASRARSELVARGFSGNQLEMATALAAAGPEDRMRLADALIDSPELKSGPWLSMLLDDPDRRVRLHVASTLATTQDSAVMERLRQRLAREEDAHVAFRLRRILGLD